MKIIGHQGTSFIDYPHKICTVYFTAGCNFRCPYCHNSHIVKEKEKVIKKKEITTFLEKRKKFIDAVCISGGEPTIHKSLPDFLEKINEKGFLIKLDTNGTNPNMIRELLERSLLNYIAVDIKAPWHKYKQAAGVNVDIEAVKESVQMLRNITSVDVEFRTTVCKDIILPEDIIEIAKILKGSQRYTVQNFRDTETVLIGQGKLHAYDKKTLKEIGNQISGWFGEFKIR